MFASSVYNCESKIQLAANVISINVERGILAPHISLQYPTERQMSLLWHVWMRGNTTTGGLFLNRRASLISSFYINLH